MRSLFRTHTATTLSSPDSFTDSRAKQPVAELCDYPLIQEKNNQPTFWQKNNTK